MTKRLLWLTLLCAWLPAMCQTNTLTAKTINGETGIFVVPPCAAGGTCKYRGLWKEYGPVLIKTDSGALAAILDWKSCTTPLPNPLGAQKDGEFSFCVNGPAATTNGFPDDYIIECEPCHGKKECSNETAFLSMSKCKWVKRSIHAVTEEEWKQLSDSIAAMREEMREQRELILRILEEPKN